MKLFQRIFFAAVLAGAVAGLCLAALQQWRVVPFILEAEQYETAQAHDHDEHQETGEATDEHSAELVDETSSEVWAPSDGVERAAYTVLATLLVSVGFALMLAAVALLSGLEITLANGLLWGLGGFIAFALAPAIGLPPELPGMAAAEVMPRQIWWAGTVLLTGAAMLVYAKFKTTLALVIGLAMIAIPHIVGAPQPPHDPSDVPAHLASGFAATTLATALMFWLLAGVLIGWFNRYFSKESA